MAATKATLTTAIIALIKSTCPSTPAVSQGAEVPRCRKAARNTTRGITKLTREPAISDVHVNMLANNPDEAMAQETNQGARLPQNIAARGPQTFPAIRSYLVMMQKTGMPGMIMVPAKAYAAIFVTSSVPARSRIPDRMLSEWMCGYAVANKVPMRP